MSKLNSLFSAQIILQATRQQYADLVKFLDRRCSIKTDEIAGFQSVRAMVRAARLVDIPDMSEKRTLSKLLETKPAKSAPTSDNP